MKPMACEYLANDASQGFHQLGRCGDLSMSVEHASGQLVDLLLQIGLLTDSLCMSGSNLLQHGLTTHVVSPHGCATAPLRSRAGHSDRDHRPRLRLAVRIPSSTGSTACAHGH